MLTFSNSILIFKRPLEEETDITPGTFIEVKLSLLAVIPLTKDVSPSISQLKTQSVAREPGSEQYAAGQPRRECL